MEDNVYFGKVIFFSIKKGYGFVEWFKDAVKQEDAFVHFSDIECEGFKALYKDQKVSFKFGTNKHGEPKAIEVTVLKN